MLHLTAPVFITSPHLGSVFATRLQDPLQLVARDEARVVSVKLFECLVEQLVLVEPELVNGGGQELHGGGEKERNWVLSSSNALQGSSSFSNCMWCTVAARTCAGWEMNRAEEKGEWEGEGEGGGREEGKRG